MLGARNQHKNRAPGYAGRNPRRCGINDKDHG